MDRPLSYWIAVARKSFDNDLKRNLEALGLSRAELAKRLGATPAYVSKFLNGPAGNYQLRTMTKLARAVGAILQVRLIKEDGEVARVVDYKTAAALDDMLDSQVQTSANDAAASNILYAKFGSELTTTRASAGSRPPASQSSVMTESYEASHG